MANLVPAKCPSCGGTLVVDPDLEVCTCEYCNNAFIVKKAINNYITNNTTINNTNIYKKKVDNQYSADIQQSQSKSQIALIIGVTIITVITFLFLAFLEFVT